MSVQGGGIWHSCCLKAGGWFPSVSYSICFGSFIHTWSSCCYFSVHEAFSEGLLLLCFLVWNCLVQLFFPPPPSFCYYGKWIRLLCKANNSTVTELVSLYLVLVVLKVVDQPAWPAGRHVWFVWHLNLFTFCQENTPSINSFSFSACSI